MITVTIVAVAFIAGVVAGVIALLRAGIAREESDNSLRGEPATRASAVTRRMVSLYVRMPPGTQPDDPANQMDAQETPPFPARPCR